LDKIVKESKFTEDLESADDLFGEIDPEKANSKWSMKSLFNMFGTVTGVIWLETYDRILKFKTIKKEHLKDDSKDPKKFEIMTLNFLIGDKRIRKILEKFQKTCNTEVFRSEGKLIIDYMW
jgi:hypothetical protein